MKEDKVVSWYQVKWKVLRFWVNELDNTIYFSSFTVRDIVRKKFHQIMAASAMYFHLGKCALLKIML